jgi:23S rRNA pseudouridine1911/1915/1917 synthase
MAAAVVEKANNISRDFRIVDETEDYVVVDKPPFLLVHPTKPNGAATLWKELRELLAFEIVNGGQVSIVNRLDRETSGLVLVAKTAAAARRCGMLMQQRRVKKIPCDCLGLAGMGNQSCRCSTRSTR